MSECTYVKGKKKTEEEKERAQLILMNSMHVRKETPLVQEF